MEIRHSTLWMAVSAMLPLMAHAATPLDIDARWKQEAVIMRATQIRQRQFNNSAKIFSTGAPNTCKLACLR